MARKPLFDACRAKVLSTSVTEQQLIFLKRLQRKSGLSLAMMVFRLLEIATKEFTDFSCLDQLSVEKDMLEVELAA